MPDLQTRIFDDKTSLDAALTAAVSEILGRAITERGRATLVVSGGSTPVNFFKLLSRENLDWARITVLLADERWVPPIHEDSNARLVRDNLLCDRAQEATFIPLKTAHADPAAGEAELDATLAATGRFDLVILGMGADGHTASLFPGSPDQDGGLSRDSGKQCIAVTPASAPHPRMSMTLPRLLDSRRIFLHITGEAKKRVLEQAIVKNDPRDLPIAAIVNQSETPVTLYYAP